MRLVTISCTSVVERLSGIVRVREVTAAVSAIVVCVEARDAGRWTTGAEIMPPAGAMALLLGADTTASLSDETLARICGALGAISLCSASTGGAETAAVGAYVGFSSLDGSLAAIDDW
jgi:hypothetical protein